MDFLREQVDIGVVMQHKCTYLSVVVYQLLHNSSAEKAGGTCNEIFIVHLKSPLSK